MTKQVAVAVAVVLAGASLAAAGDSRRPAREDAPRLMKEAVTAGEVDMAAFGAIADWILHEKEEKVAAGLLDALAAAEPAVTGAADQRWEPTARAVFSLFAAVLRDAEGNRRRSGRDLEPQVAALVNAAAPAVLQTLREVDPESKARLAALLAALGPIREDLAVLAGTDALAAAGEALKKD